VKILGHCEIKTRIMFGFFARKIEEDKG